MTVSVCALLLLTWEYWPMPLKITASVSTDSVKACLRSCRNFCMTTTPNINIWTQTHRECPYTKTRSIYIKSKMSLDAKSAFVIRGSPAGENQNNLLLFLFFFLPFIKVYSIHVRHTAHDTCIWTSPRAKLKQDLPKSSSSGPQLRGCCCCCGAHRQLHATSKSHHHGPGRMFVRGCVRLIRLSPTGACVMWHCDCVCMCVCVCVVAATFLSPRLDDNYHPQ